MFTVLEKLKDDSDIKKASETIRISKFQPKRI
jgi:hypothetical protein